MSSHGAWFKLVGLGLLLFWQALVELLSSGTNAVVVEALKALRHLADQPQLHRFLITTGTAGSRSGGSVCMRQSPLLVRSRAGSRHRISAVIVVEVVCATWWFMHSFPAKDERR